MVNFYNILKKMTCALIVLWVYSFAAHAKVEYVKFLPENSNIDGSMRGSFDIALAFEKSISYQIITTKDPLAVVIRMKNVTPFSLTETLFTGWDAIHRATITLEVNNWLRLTLYTKKPVRLIETSNRKGVIKAEFMRVKLGGKQDQDRISMSDLYANELVVSRKDRNKKPVIMIDPGHGGIDSGATRHQIEEKNIVLEYSLRLAEKLRAGGQYEVKLTRENDSFIGLYNRIEAAEVANADLFISIHADAVEEGGASGATVYSLAQEASDKSSHLLAKRLSHDRILDDLQLAGEGDDLTIALMELGRTDNMAKSWQFGQFLAQKLRSSSAGTQGVPHLRANFAVLKAPNIPSALIELGFMSDVNDLERMRSSIWQQEFASQMADAIREWLETEQRSKQP